uniref:Uncharacterized protein n=1 Tax=Sphaeramia orbicularis TaxID=375764 RepID=A0A672Z893_9TELE
MSLQLCGHVLTVFSFSTGISKTHLSFESISSSGFASFHWRDRKIIWKNASWPTVVKTRDSFGSQTK